MKSNSQSKRVVCNPFPRSLIQVSRGHGVDAYWGLCAERARGEGFKSPAPHQKLTNCGLIDLFSLTPKFL